MNSSSLWEDYRDTNKKMKKKKRKVCCANRLKTGDKFLYPCEKHCTTWMLHVKRTDDQNEANVEGLSIGGRVSFTIIKNIVKKEPLMVYYKNRKRCSAKTSEESHEFIQTLTKRLKTCRISNQLAKYNVNLKATTFLNLLNTAAIQQKSTPKKITSQEERTKLEMQKENSATTQETSTSELAVAGNAISNEIANDKSPIQSSQNAILEHRTVYRCHQCFNYFLNVEELMQHLLSQHKIIQKEQHVVLKMVSSYICRICGEKLNTKHGLKAHLLINHKIEIEDDQTEQVAQSHGQTLVPNLIYKIRNQIQNSIERNSPHVLMKVPFQEQCTLTPEEKVGINKVLDIIKPNYLNSPTTRTQLEELQANNLKESSTKKITTPEQPRGSKSVSLLHQLLTDKIVSQEKPTTIRTHLEELQANNLKESTTKKITLEQPRGSKSVPSNQLLTDKSVSQEKPTTTRTHLEELANKLKESTTKKLTTLEQPRGSKSINQEKPSSSSLPHATSKPATSEEIISVKWSNADGKWFNITSSKAIAVVASYNSGLVMCVTSTTCQYSEQVKAIVQNVMNGLIQTNNGTVRYLHEASTSDHNITVQLLNNGQKLPDSSKAIAVIALQNVGFDTYLNHSYFVLQKNTDALTNCKENESHAVTANTEMKTC